LFKHRVTLPPPVRPGDRVGVAALSGPVDRARLAAGVAALERLGFEPVLADNAAEREPSGLFAGDDARRLAGFHRLAADPSLTAIFFARGGHGMLRVLPGLDWELLARHPRAYVGYSDLTPLLLAIPQRLGWAAFHGPLVAGDLARGLSAEEEGSLLAALAGEPPAALPVSVAAEDRGRPPVEGPLLGGCLSLLTALLGTPFAPDLDGAIVFVEDVAEPLYRLDRMLTHLRLSGSLAHVRALIFGHLTGPEAPREETVDPLITLRAGLARSPFPLAWGLAAGHRSPNLTLPLGVTARLEPAAGRLVVGAGDPP
jgi:muramoyltetrapeptide carboxypeptidase